MYQDDSDCTFHPDTRSSAAGVPSASPAGERESALEQVLCSAPYPGMGCYVSSYVWNALLGVLHQDFMCSVQVGVIVYILIGSVWRSSHERQLRESAFLSARRSAWQRRTSNA